MHPPPPTPPLSHPDTSPDPDSPNTSTPTTLPTSRTESVARRGQRVSRLNEYHRPHGPPSANRTQRTRAVRKGPRATTHTQTISQPKQNVQHQVLHEVEVDRRKEPSDDTQRNRHETEDEAHSPIITIERNRVEGLGDKLHSEELQNTADEDHAEEDSVRHDPFERIQFVVDLAGVELVEELGPNESVVDDRVPVALGGVVPSPVSVNRDAIVFAGDRILSRQNAILEVERMGGPI
mmetsp:Transcript_52986/g.139661  ORF Transcript_52986/g.139661 Transcript_52986/m.139661 type:complete len:236 (+) Transcript_52986:33-740(+)